MIAVAGGASLRRAMGRVWAARLGAGCRAGRGDVAELAAVVALGPEALRGALGRDVAEVAAVEALLAAARLLGLLGVGVLGLGAVAADVAHLAAVVARLAAGATGATAAGGGRATALGAVALEVADLSANVARPVSHYYICAGRRRKIMGREKQRSG